MHNVGTPRPAIRSRVFEVHESFPIERPGGLVVTGSVCAHETHGVLLPGGGVLWTFRDGSRAFTRALLVTETLRDLLFHRQMVLQTIASHFFIPIDCSGPTVIFATLKTYTRCDNETDRQVVSNDEEQRLCDARGSRRLLGCTRRDDKTDGQEVTSVMD
jgi:hypothetical protein